MSCISASSHGCLWVQTSAVHPEGRGGVACDSHSHRSVTGHPVWSVTVRDPGVASAPVWDPSVGSKAPGQSEAGVNTRRVFATLPAIRWWEASRLLSYRAINHTCPQKTGNWPSKPQSTVNGGQTQAAVRRPGTGNTGDSSGDRLHRRLQWGQATRVTVVGTGNMSDSSGDRLHRQL